MLSVLLLSLILVSCADDSTSPNSMARVQVVSTMSSPSVVSHNKSSFNEVEIDSLVITNFRMLISNIKLHGYNEVDEKNESLKVGPFLIQADSTYKLYFIAENTVPTGSYDKVKFEIHKFPDSERVKFENDEVFGDFATKDKYTIIVSGYYYENGSEIPFTFKSNMTENLSIKFDSKIELTDDKINTLVIDIDPNLLFLKSGLIIRPTEENWKDIEKNIHSSIKIVKKILMIK